MMKRSLKQLYADRRGSSSVEFVFGVMFVLIIMIGMLEMGRAIHYYQVVTDGVRSGTRYLTRVDNPCTDPAIRGALGLVVTRTIKWTGAPVFTDWPPEPIGTVSNPLADNFEFSLEGCTGGALTGEKVILAVRYRYQDYLGLLALIGLQDGFWIGARHEELFIGT